VTSRAEFAKQLAELKLSHVDRAIALLWFYDQTQEYEERSPGDLASDVHEEGFPRPNVSRLRADLTKSRSVVRGARKGTFRIDIRRRQALDDQYLPLLDVKIVEVEGAVLNPDLVGGTRGYLQKLVHQINGSYEYGFYDAAAVLCRRLMESLIIEVYIHETRGSDIRNGGAFLKLERLIAHVRSDSAITLSRNAPKNMVEIKQLGDTAAHDRTYITQQGDIDDVKAKFRRLIQELLSLSGIKT